MDSSTHRKKICLYRQRCIDAAAPTHLLAIVRDEEILVYALLEDAMADLEAGEMGRRVHKLEGGS